MGAGSFQYRSAEGLVGAGVCFYSCLDSKDPSVFVAAYSYGLPHWMALRMEKKAFRARKLHLHRLFQ